MNELDLTNVSGILVPADKLPPPPAEMTHRDEMVSGIVWMQSQLDEQAKTNAELRQKLMEATAVKRAVDELDLDVEKSKVDVFATLESFIRMFVSEHTQVIPLDDRGVFQAHANRRHYRFSTRSRLCPKLQRLALPLMFVRIGKAETWLPSRMVEKRHDA